MKRRHLLAAGCAHCAGLWSAVAGAQAADGSAWIAPDRFAKPDLGSDEGGLWAMMEREETRLRRSPFVMRDAALRDYLQGIACKLGGNHCPDVRVYPVRTPFFNASMAPNGMMQVWSGLLLRVDNEAQLAGVIGHEMGHYMQRHMLDRLRDIKARTAFSTFMAAFGLVGLVGQLAAAAGALAFSRDQEREADGIGLALMRQAGYDPREAGKVWGNLRAELEAVPGGDPTKSSPLFATHPPSDERSETLARLAESAGSGFLGEAEYAAKLAPFQFQLLDDELKRGQHGETLALLDRLVKRSPERADLFYFRGETRRLRAGSEDLANALLDLGQAIALGNEPAQVHRAIGYIHQKQERGAEARAAFSRYVDRAPDAPDANLIRAYLTESKT
ncbi:Beta-barrel assembly-enhancing protease [Burkholderiaceae bacterium]|nr:Beta-barrel assembly-enhancing protease [Burkholderiaceae bacterium]